MIRQMEAALLARLSMARRGGDLALGQDAVFAAAGSGKLSLLILPLIWARMPPPSCKASRA